MTSISIPTSLDDLLQHREWLRKLAHRLVNESAVDDVLQDTCIRVLDHGVPSDRPTRPWLATVMRNVVRMNHRASRRRRERERHGTSMGNGLPSPEELLDRVELERELAGLVTNLHEPYRSTLLLRYYEGLSSASIARSQGVAAATVRWRLQRALEDLRRCLDQKHGGERSRWHAALIPIARLDLLYPAAKMSVASKVVPAAIKELGATKGLLVSAAAVTTLAAVGWSVAPADWPAWRDASVAPAVASRSPSRAHQERHEPPSMVAQTRKDTPVSNPNSVAPGGRTRSIEPATRAKLLAQIHRLQRQRSLITGGSRAPEPEGSGSTGPLAAGGIDKAYIRAQMAELLPVFRECYDLSLARNPDLEGRIAVDFTIVGEPDVGGLVESSEYNAQESTIVEPHLVECVRESVYTLEFPPPQDGGTITVTYPLEFTTE